MSFLTKLKLIFIKYKEIEIWKNLNVIFNKNHIQFLNTSENFRDVILYGVDEIKIYNLWNYIYNL